MDRQVSRWFVQCLKEQAVLLEIMFLYYAYFEMPPSDLLIFTRLFKEQGFGQRQTNRHLADKSMDALVERIGSEHADFLSHTHTRTQTRMYNKQTVLSCSQVF